MIVLVGVRERFLLAGVSDGASTFCKSPPGRVIKQ
jgi:hypothetical protein